MLCRISHVWRLDLFWSGHIFKLLCPSFTGAVPKKSWLLNEIRFIWNASQRSCYECPVTKSRNLNQKKNFGSHFQMHFIFFNPSKWEGKKQWYYLFYNFWVANSRQYRSKTLAFTMEKSIVLVSTRISAKYIFNVIGRNIFKHSSRLKSP